MFLGCGWCRWLSIWIRDHIILAAASVGGRISADFKKVLSVFFFSGCRIFSIRSDPDFVGAVIQVIPQIST